MFVEFFAPVPMASAVDTLVEVLPDHALEGSEGLSDASQVDGAASKYFICAPVLVRVKFPT
jgi:hypothetical protein